MTHLRTILIATSLLVLSGCSSIAAIDNESLVSSDQNGGYSLQGYNTDLSRSDDITLILAFSGGGSRAAAFSYGVMESLRDTRVMLDGKEVRLLDEIDMITSVSGGSFTAAYYGLYGEQLFDNFRTDFLEPDYMSEWLYAIASPLFWFSSQSRTDLASRIYEERLFGNATFSDLHKARAPLIIMNATDLGGGTQKSQRLRQPGTGLSQES
ncbi:patatin-like phospholipase family protein [Pseudidiomarina sp.]|uniref:patatin-like phospholipase family protein n=1 Tax=Pseudidiomarina sp. TaxID=2081707 RepID=UPI00299F367E|nr:patatin-like phospholipase family protein [Pseudidiomarina sp.]MDX1706551.1 patatin-like phospholipase family protein [Pseudidiomarina sp.]